MFGRSHSASSAYLPQNLLTPLRNLIFGRHLWIIGICFSNRPIADFFHDQTIFLKDCELYTMDHSLGIDIILCASLQTFGPFYLVRALKNLIFTTVEEMNYARFNIVSGSEGNMTTPCEMEFFNFLWLIWVHYIPLAPT